MIQNVQLEWAGLPNIPLRFSRPPFVPENFSNFESAIVCIKKDERLKSAQMVLRITRPSDGKVWEDAEIWQHIGGNKIN